VVSPFNYANPAQATLMTGQNPSFLGKDRLEQGADAKTWFYHHYCVVRLGDISTFCEQLPMLTGPYFQLKIRLNQVMDYKITVTPGSLITKAHNMSNDICPFMRMSTPSDGHDEYDQAGDLGAAHLTTDYTYELRLGSLKDGTSHDMSRPRWVMATYSLSETLDAQILSNPVRTLNYTELNHAQFLNVPSGYFSFNLSSSTRDMERLVIIPMLSADSNGAHTGGVKVNGLASITHGLNTSPCVIENMKLNVSGRPLYTQPFRYDYEQYLQEMYDVVGNKNNNGSISLEDFTNIYHYFSYDLSRVDVSDIGAQASYEINGTLMNSSKYDFYVFFVQRRHIDVDITTSQIL
jgi:hypothetical protein